MVNTLTPAAEVFDAAMADVCSFAEALDALTAVVETGRDSTIDLVARIGRASRLGERSRGLLDAGATSCAVILSVLADGARARLPP
jgi:dihydroxyacetone kinase-like protein